MTVRVGILGATGYAALELIKILLRHAEAEITVLTSRQEGRPHLCDVHPILSGRLDINFDHVEAVDLAGLGILSVEAVREEISDIVSEIISMRDFVLSVHEQQQVVDDICNDVLGLGPLLSLIHI